MLEAKGVRAMSEYRLWITVPDLPLGSLDEEQPWEPWIAFLERHHSELGPVLTWDGRGGAMVIIALDADSEAHAVRAGVDVVSDALHRTGLGDRYPRLVEVEKTMVEA
jgi:hypothetical protein